MAGDPRLERLSRLCLLVARDPRRYYLPAYIGPRGWVALHLDRRPLDWDEIEALVKTSYRAVAPKRRAARLA
jgi:hypothetical protein